jgi:hypothetical protein
MTSMGQVCLEELPALTESMETEGGLIQRGEEAVEEVEEPPCYVECDDHGKQDHAANKERNRLNTRPSGYSQYWRKISPKIPSSWGKWTRIRD